MNQHINYWNKKIISWEQNKYIKKDLFSSPIIARQEFAYKYLENKIENKVVFELGCGSGFFYEKIKEINFKKYYGIDLAPISIESFQSRLTHAQDARVFLECGDAIKNFKADANIVIALGVIDWLDHDQISHLFSNLKTTSFLMSYSSLNHSIFMTKLHSIYSSYFQIKLSSSVRPTYHSDIDILKYTQMYSIDAKILNPRGMSFGKFITNIF